MERDQWEVDVACGNQPHRRDVEPERPREATYRERGCLPNEIGRLGVARTRQEQTRDRENAGHHEQREGQSVVTAPGDDGS
jgi:hypothetical protein